MSLSNQVTKDPSPVSKYVEYKSGGFSYYDKDLKERIPIQLQDMIMLDNNLRTIVGFSEEHSCGIWSNEVRRFPHNGEDTTLHVRIGGDKNPVISGQYKDIKSDLPVGAKYANCAYIMDSSGEVMHLKLFGAGLEGRKVWKDKKSGEEVDSGDCGWFSFVEQHGSKLESGRYYFSQVSEAKKVKGSVQYISPVFEITGEVPDDVFDMAVEADRLVQKYLNKYFDKPVVDSDDGEVDIDESDSVESVGTTVSTRSTKLDKEPEIMVKSNGKVVKTTKADLLSFISDKGLDPEEVIFREGDNEWQKASVLMDTPEESGSLDDLLDSGSVAKASEKLPAKKKKKTAKKKSTFKPALSLDEGDEDGDLPF